MASPSGVIRVWEVTVDPTFASSFERQVHVRVSKVNRTIFPTLHVAGKHAGDMEGFI